MNEEIISLGWDPGVTTGWACVGKRIENIDFDGTGDWIEIKKPHIEIISTGKIVLEEKALHRKLLQFEKEVREIITLIKPWIITCEQINYSRNLATTRNLSYYQAVIALEAGRKDLSINFIGASEARKAIGLKGNATKEEVAKHLKKMFNNDTDVDWGDNNITDALAIATAIVKEVKNDEVF